MADLERSVMGAASALQPQQGQHDLEDLPSLIGRLGDNVVTLLDTKLSLAKVEIKQEATGYAKSAVGIAVGALVAAIGFVLVNVAIAFFVSTLFSFDQPINYALGFILTGLAYLIIGGIVIYFMKNRLTAQNPVPERSVEELRKDKQWLKNEM
ncbi:MAG: phage holin family protein [Pyrinomonadaceae bacterium]